MRKYLSTNELCERLRFVVLRLLCDGMIADSVTGRWGECGAELDLPVNFEPPKTDISFTAYRTNEYPSILILNYRTDPGPTLLLFYRTDPNGTDLRAITGEFTVRKSLSMVI